MPIKWENNVLGFVPRTDWLSVPFNPTRPGDPADLLIDDMRTDNLMAEWQSIAAAHQIPAMAMFHSFDVEAQKTVRVPVDTHNIEKGLIKVKINQSERLRALTRAGVQGDDAMYRYVMNDGFNLAEQVITRAHVAKNELLASGAITIKENNLDLTVDYGVPAAQKALTIAFGANDDVPAQIQSIIDQAKAAGVTITGMFTSGSMLTKMRKHESMQKIIGGNMAAGALVRKTALKEFLSEEFGINVVVEQDYTYAYDRGLDASGQIVQSTKRYYPINKVTFFAQVNGGKLATGLWGDSPEADLPELLKIAPSQRPFVTITQWAENDPAVLWTKASALFMPVLFNPGSLWIATESTSEGDDEAEG